MKTAKTLLLILIVFLFAGCSLEKRHYMPGYYVNWETKKNNIPPKNLNNGEILSDVTNSEVGLDNKGNFPLTVSNDSAITIFLLKSNLKNTAFICKQSDTLKSKLKKTAPKKNKKPIDPTKDSKTSLLLGIFANCLILFGMGLLLLVLSLSSFSYVLYMLAMLSIITAFIFVIIGLIKAIKVLQYLKVNPEDNKKNKTKATIGFILNMFILTIPLAYLALIIFALGT